MNFPWYSNTKCLCQAFPAACKVYWARADKIGFQKFCQDHISIGQLIDNRPKLAVQFAGFDGDFFSKMTTGARKMQEIMRLKIAVPLVNTLW